jgi:hypothetical protein
MSANERTTTKQLLSEIERAKAEQLDIARSWILLFTLAATVGFWWEFYSQLKLVRGTCQVHKRAAGHSASA